MSTTDHAFFYNSVDGDRVYDADSFEYWLKKFFTTGVFTGDCAVSPTSGMGIQMAAGYANVDGKVKFFENASSFTLSTANPSHDRIDTVVIERNDSDRDITAKVVTGTASASPTATAPVRTGGVYQLVVAQIYVAAGATSIAAADITDKRTDTSVCGYVITACQTPDFTELYSQFTNAFDTWFNTMKGQLSEDAAGNLQLEIDEINTNLNRQDLIWENNAPTSAISSDVTINKDLSIYESVVIIYTRMVGEDSTETEYVNLSVPNSYDAHCFLKMFSYGGYDLTIAQRRIAFDLTLNKIIIDGNAYGTEISATQSGATGTVSEVTASYYLIPIRIYGIKKIS